ncbi:glycosyltransferase family 2 protein, partial [Cognatishimia sp.]|uniref:glycosyltransferase family 2 protein n=1 Tax=Cognatishimia sp. TaxID=2211648 RepID=UPI0035199834
MSDATAHPQFDHHVIAHQRFGEDHALDVLAVGSDIRVFGVGTLTAGQFSARQASIRAVGGHQILAFPAQEVRPHIRVSHPQTEAFAGQHCILAFRNTQSVETTVNWLRWHVERHGITSALIVDRTDPAKDTGFAQDLKRATRDLPDLHTLTVVQCDLPLGDPTLPAESHPFCAPEAPGKDRMTVPEPDPWHAPLAQLNVIELLRWRYLQSAETVTLLDVSDLLEPVPGRRFTDEVAQAPNGAILLQGASVYPWRVRKGQPPHFSDHICRQFDASQKLTRWSLAPAKTPTTRLWRPFFTPGGAIGAAEPWPFCRYMGLRHNAESISKIVPKTALIEEPTLMRHAVDYWNAKPVPVPQQSAKRPSKKPNSVAIVTCMKNEGPFILEWLAYHRVIGVESFLVYTNDCTDGTDHFLDLLQAKGLVQHRDNPFRETGLKPQHAALHAADSEPMMQAADWLVCMDVDEFINVKVGDGRLPDLFAAVGEANMIAMTWRLFGNSDQHLFRDAPIIGDYTRCAAEMTRKPHQAWGFKTLYR